MSREIRFRTLLPIAETVVAALFGGVGLWQRKQILSQPYLGRPDFVGEHRTLPWVALAVACKEVPLLRRSC